MRKVQLFNVQPQSSHFSCSNCQQNAQLRYSQCGSVKYCNANCQKQNWKIHKDYCKKITKYKKQTRKLAIGLLDCNISENENNCNAFDKAYGRFLNFDHTKRYCESRRELAMSLYDCGQLNESNLAWELVLEHMLDLLWLCHNDDLGLHTIIATIFNSLERPQESHDFMKWWNLTFANDNYDWDDTSLTFCTMNGEDVFENLNQLKLEKATLDQLLQFFVLKYKILVATFKILKNDEALYAIFVEGVGDNYGVLSPLLRLKNLPIVLDRIKHYVAASTLAELDIVADHLKDIGGIINERNIYVIPGLIDTKAFLASGLPMPWEFEPLTPRAKAFSLIHDEHVHWENTPGLVLFLKEIYAFIKGDMPDVDYMRQLSED